MNRETHANKSSDKMPIYTCTCGAQILVVPDMMEMQRAIATHVAEHRRRTGKRLSEEALTEGILSLLSELFI
jgi:hypothetical protein